MIVEDDEAKKYEQLKSRLLANYEDFVDEKDNKRAEFCKYHVLEQFLTIRGIYRAYQQHAEKVRREAREGDAARSLFAFKNCEQILGLIRLLEKDANFQLELRLYRHQAHLFRQLVHLLTRVFRLTSQQQEHIRKAVSEELQDILEGKFSLKLVRKTIQREGPLWDSVREKLSQLWRALHYEIKRNVKSYEKDLEKEREREPRSLSNPEQKQAEGGASEQTTPCPKITLTIENVSSSEELRFFLTTE